jgi:hypothetical protein
MWCRALVSRARSPVRIAGRDGPTLLTLTCPPYGPESHAAASWAQSKVILWEWLRSSLCVDVLDQGEGWRMVGALLIRGAVYPYPLPCLPIPPKGMTHTAYGYGNDQPTSLSGYPYPVPLPTHTPYGYLPIPRRSIGAKRSSYTGERAVPLIISAVQTSVDHSPIPFVDQVRLPQQEVASTRLAVGPDQAMRRAPAQTNPKPGGRAKLDPGPRRAPYRSPCVGGALQTL